MAMVPESWSGHEPPVSEEPPVEFLSESQRRAVFEKVLVTVNAKFMGPNPDIQRLRADHERTVLQSQTAEDFERR